MYRAFYRERPFSANVSLLALEWANFSLSVAFILVRMIKLVIAACFFIGRLDTPFLADKVGRLYKFELDNYPTIFVKDLLQHEGKLMIIGLLTRSVRASQMFQFSLIYFPVLLSSSASIH